MKEQKKIKKKVKLKSQEETIINLKKELIFLKIKEKTKQSVKPHLVKEIKNKISKNLALSSKINTKTIE